MAMETKNDLFCNQLRKPTRMTLMSPINPIPQASLALKLERHTVLWKDLRLVAGGLSTYNKAFRVSDVILHFFTLKNKCIALK